VVKGDKTVNAGLHNLSNNNNNRFYDPLIQDNPGEQVPAIIGHINPHYHHYPPQYL